MVNVGSEPGLNGPERDQPVLKGAIWSAHKKIQLAQRKDLLLMDGNAEGTYRYAPVRQAQKEGITDRHVKATLIPSYGDVHQAKISRVNLAVPTKPWTQVPQELRDNYQAVLLEDLADHNLNTTGLWEPPVVPTNDVFGKAFNNAGESIKFLLNPSGLFAYTDKGNIVPAQPTANIEGQYYAIHDTIDTAFAQNELLTDWFDANELKEILDAYEPAVYDSSQWANGSAA